MKLSLLQSMLTMSLVLVFFIFLSLCVTVTNHPLEEDAFITFRYAENYVNGNGLVFNKSEKVEGISNFLWLIILVILSKLSFPLVTSSAIVGLMFGILSILTIWLFSILYLQRHCYNQFIAPLLLATHTSFFATVTNGLETSFYTFLITIGAISFILENNEKKLFPFSSIIFSLASITRPEAPLLYCSVMAICISSILTHRIRRYAGYLVVSSLIFCLVYGSFILFRISYYQDIFPNVVYSRINIDKLGTDCTSLWFSFFIDTKSYFIFMPILFLFYNYSLKRCFYPMVMVVTIHLVYLLLYCPTLIRYVVPILPLSFLLVQEGLFNISQILKSKCITNRFMQWFVPLLTATIVLVNLFGYEYSPLFFQSRLNPLLINLKKIIADPTILRGKFEAYRCHNTPQNFHALFGAWIRKNIPEGSVIVYDQMGQTPFYGGLNYTFIDSWGLTNKFIAEIIYKENNPTPFKLRTLVLNTLPYVEVQASKDITFAEYILSRNPDYVFLMAENPFLKKLISSYEFNKRYRKFFPEIPREIKACYKRINHQ